MIKYFLFSPVLLALILMPLQGVEANELPTQLRSHVSILASDSLQGRGLGTIGAQRARRYITEQFREAGIVPLGSKDYLQAFSIRQNLAWVDAWNIVGVVRGSDPALRDEYIVIGAHYDHLGYTLQNDEQRIFPGADDNASGVAAIIELGRYFAGNPHLLGRSLIVVAFDAEESGLLGSKYFVNNPPVAIERIKKMFSLDMVGMYTANNGVNLLGIASLQGGDALAQSQAREASLSIRRSSGNIERRTDTAPFGDAGIPATHVFTGQKSPYHKPGDQYHLLDYEGMANIVKFMGGFINQLSLQENLEPTPSLLAGASSESSPSRLRPGVGWVINTGSGFHRYPDEFFTADAAFAFSTGLYFRMPVYRMLSMQIEALYDVNGSKISGGKFQRQSLTVPLNLQIGTQGQSGADVNLFYFAGPYYRYSFAGKVAGEEMDFDELFHREEWGYSMGVGINIFRFTMAYTSRRALTGLSRIDAYNLRDSNGYFTLSYRF